MVTYLTEENQKSVALEVANIINDGGVVIAPTDTVYGILADAFDIRAINKIYEIKEREREKPLLILIKDIKYCKQFSEMEVPEIVRENVPGELTFIMPLSNDLKYNFTYLKSTVALRIPKDPFMSQILKNTPPIVAPSANPSGHGAICDGNKIVEMYKDKVDLIVNKGIIEKKMPSTLYDCINKKVLRHGSVII